MEQPAEFKDRPPLAKHRFDALQDGVYAIAITLLVLELRLPGHDSIHGADDLLKALGELLPKLTAWLVSFGVLAVFWMASMRAQAWVRHLDVRLIWINLLSLMFASFLPFASSLVGEHPDLWPSQCLYAGAMAGMALTALLQLMHLSRHPELCHMPMPPGMRRAAITRIGGLLATTVLAIGIALVDPRFSTMAFMLMAVISPLSQRMERRPAR
jgi:uncharacterized membrane protein